MQSGTIQEYGNPEWGLNRNLGAVGFDEALADVKAALAAQGFGVLTEIDVKAVMKAKLGADERDYVIVGACNPELAHRALSGEPGLGLLLPCNVVVARQPDDTVVLSAADPARLFSVVGDPSVAPIADQARELLLAAVNSV